MYTFSVTILFLAMFKSVLMISYNVSVIISIYMYKQIWKLMKYALMVETCSFSVLSDNYDWQYFKVANYRVIMHIWITFFPLTFL